MQNLLLQIIEIDSALRTRAATAEEKLAQAKQQALQDTVQDTGQIAAQQASQLLAQADAQIHELIRARNVRSEAELWALRDIYEKNSQDWIETIVARCLNTGDKL